MSGTLSDVAIQQALSAVLPADALAFEPADRALYAADASRRPGTCAAVVRPVSEDEVVRAVQAARRHGFTLVSRGAGTSPTGSASAHAGQVVIDLSRMNRIVSIDARDQIAVVEPGVMTGVLQERAEAAGLFYPPDPASSRVSTIGGNVATCAGGLRAAKYGVTRDYVLGLRAVLADGRVLVTGGRTLKSVVGYDLTRLLVGSEGTLAIFTQIVLRLIPRPAAAETVLASFATADGGFTGADAVLASGVLPRALEYMDGDITAIAAAYLGEAAPTGVGSRLLVEVDGDALSVADGVERVIGALKAAGATEARRARDAAERDALWRGRRAISPAVYRVTPAKKSEDLGVPRSALGTAIAAIKQAGREAGIRVLAYGHAGDANLHVNFLYDPALPGETARLATAIDRAVEITLAHGGTVSGEHGIGLTKLREMGREVPPEALALMHGIKHLFDPTGMLNPGKALAPLAAAGLGN